MNPSKIVQLQKYLSKKNIQHFIINRTDEFLGEYIAPYAERLNWLTNFSGSAGRAIISQESAKLFVDGRYTVQAKEQINKNEILLNSLVVKRCLVLNNFHRSQIEICIFLQLQK